VVDLPELSIDAGSRGLPTDADQRLSQLHQAHANALTLFLSKSTTDNRRATEELVRETLLRASRTLGQLDPDPMTVRPWLFTLARRVAIEFHRSRQARPFEAGVRGQGRAARTSGLTEQVPDGRVAVALKKLRPEHRRVIVELYYRGQTVQETASLLAVPEAAVKSHAHHALRALRSAMQTTTEVTPGPAGVPAQ
jgi:RNA polymerase sigma-70 factor (ECF subfamily)